MKKLAYQFDHGHDLKDHTAVVRKIKNSAFLKDYNIDEGQAWLVFVSMAEQIAAKWLVEADAEAVAAAVLQRTTVVDDTPRGGHLRQEAMEVTEAYAEPERKRLAA